MKSFYELIGEGENNLTSSEISIRAFIIFFVALILIRLAGRRSFGMRSSFDNVMSILLGAVLSKSVTGGIPFFLPVSAAFIIAFTHRLVAWLCVRSDKFGILVKGREKLLYRDGKFFEKNLASALISKKDFREGLRKENVGDPEKVEEAYLERDGSISVVKKE